jgi:cephalosporin-C deacetylase-like acetyl esterase
MPLARVAVLVAAAALAAVGLSGRSSQPASVGQLQTAVGAYRFADGDIVALFIEPFGNALRIVDYGNGAMRQLERRSSDEFVAGPRLGASRPVESRLRLVLDAAGNVVALWRDGVRANRVPLTVSRVAFKSGDARLVGKLVRPRGAGPFPAVVIVPGSVRATRDTYDLWSFFFAAHGFAVLSHDKRGVGDSTGRYHETPSQANIRQLAGDALAAVAWLRQRADVDPTRVGLSGGSQAGWIISLAASESTDVAFAALQSGPAMSVGRQRAYAALTVNGAREPPPTDAEIHSALDTHPDAGFDPRPAIAALRIPTLWQYGDVDKRQYTPESVAILAEVAPSATVHVYAGGAHSLRVTTNGLVSEERGTTGFVPGLFDDLAAWLSLRAAP